MVIAAPLAGRFLSTEEKRPASGAADHPPAFAGTPQIQSANRKRMIARIAFTPSFQVIFFPSS